jgi:alpha-mannosidase
LLRSFQERRLERLQRRIEEFRAWRNARQHPIPEWQFTAGGQTRQLRLGDFWPVIEAPVQFRAEAQVPPDWDGQPVELELWVGGEGFVRFSTGYQAGLNPMHHRFPVTEKAKGGETITIDVEAVPKGIFGTDIPEPRLERAQLVVPQREMRGLERDLTMLLEAGQQLGSHEVVPFLLDAAEAALSELAGAWPTATEIAVSRYVLGYDNGIGAGTGAVPPDWVSEAIDAARPTQPTWSLPPAPRALEPLPDAAVEAVNLARATLAARLERIKQEYPPVGSLCLTGHAHIDLAWLWPYAETRRKTRRTFSTVLDLMERYPDFTFNQSSAQAYAWMEEDDPAVFERIKQRVAEGRWEPVGGMWLESDCNVTGGESLVRQVVYGQRYFEQAFGKRHTVAWLPDVFGFTGQFPQILKAGGIDGFFTIKMYWNEATFFPFDLFEWEGIDGSRVLAHLFLNPGHGYNGNIVPLDTLGTWRNFRAKTKHPESLLAFGWGDGAGGPTEKMLENYARLKDFPAMPRLRMGSVEEFYAAVNREGLPRFVGELYFELHRGTLTTQAKVKKLNREAEHRLVEAEAFATIASQRGFAYPAAEIETAWKSVLLNQFHDVLPGSSIREVYEDTHRMLGEVVETATRIRDEALTHLGGGTGDAANGPSATAEGKVLVGNAASLPRELEAFLPGVDGDTVVTLPDGEAARTQAVEGGALVFAAQHLVPSLGWSVLSLSPATDEAAPELAGVEVRESGGGAVLENALTTVEIGADGTIARYYDKSYQREVLADRANQLWAYVDKPRSWDAWDVDETYERDGEEITGVERIEVTESGPIRASVRIERVWRGSRIAQTYRLWHGTQRLDIETEVDWHERQVLLRARFPLAIHAHEATFETAYGAVRRPTHRNTAKDAAQFEGSGHRFADLSEAGYGVALLNDGKYGHGVHGNVLSLSLLRSPLYPDALADEGEHRFTYALCPHGGTWSQSYVAHQAFELNSPLITVPVSGTEERSAGFVEIAAWEPELGLGALKPAFDGDGLILRLYEPYGARGPVMLRFGQPVKSVERVNLLEEPADGAPVDLADEGASARFPVQPFEIVTLRIRP